MKVLLATLWSDGSQTTDDREYYDCKDHLEDEARKRKSHHIVMGEYLIIPVTVKEGVQNTVDCFPERQVFLFFYRHGRFRCCLLYTSDAADES